MDFCHDLCASLFLDVATGVLLTVGEGKNITCKHGFLHESLGHCQSMTFFNARYSIVFGHLSSFFGAG